MLILQTLLSFLFFVSLSFLVFYVAGFGVVAFKKNTLKDEEIIVFSLSLGLVFFVILAILLGSLNIRHLMLPILILTIIYLIVIRRNALFSPWKVLIKDKILLTLLVLGILTQGFINFPSGYQYKEGMMFWSSQGHDGLWHVALMEEIKKNYPPQNPVFSGERLYNYHYLVDVLMGEFYRIFPFFSSLDLYFRFFPPLFSFMIGISVFAFVNAWQKRRQIGYLAVFFTYFVGSFGYIVTYIKHKTIFGGETVFWAAQINTILGNPPHAIAIAFMSAFFLSFYFFIRERNKFWFLVSFFLAFTLAGFKVSAGLTLLIGLIFASLSDLFFKRNWSTAVLFGILGLSNFITIKLMTKGVTSFLIFLPWWFVRTMVVAGNRLDWVDLEHKRQHYLSVGRWTSYLRVVQLETMAFFIFLIGNLGMRFLGFFEIFKKFSSPINFFTNPLEVLLLTTCLTGFLIPMLFVQRGIIYNNIQFMQYFLLIFGFYAAVSTYKLTSYFKKRLVKLVVLLSVVFLSIPTVIGNMVEFYGRPPLAKISNRELEGLMRLKKQSSANDVLLTMPFNKFLHGKFGAQPWPIYVWYSTPYISAISTVRTYLTAEEQVLITGYPLDNRLEKANAFFRTYDYYGQKAFLKENKITYIYLAKGEIENPLNLSPEIIDKFFENEEVIIYRVR